jgi:hypothetical protein
MKGKGRDIREASTLVSIEGMDPSKNIESMIRVPLKKVFV